MPPEGGWFGWLRHMVGETLPQSVKNLSPAERSLVVGRISSVAKGLPTLSRQDYDQYYRGFANGTLWPVLHYQIGLGRFERPEYEGYRRVNALSVSRVAPPIPVLRGGAC